MDKISGHPLIASLPNLERIQSRMEENNLLTLYDILVWDHSSAWKGWKSLHPSPHHLKREYDLFYRICMGNPPLTFKFMTSEGGVVTVSNF